MDPKAVDAVRVLAFAARSLETACTELTLPQYRVLTLLSSSPERASRIAQMASVSRPSLTGILDGLEAKGYVRRNDVEGDRRGVLLEVTADGHRARDEAEAAMAEKLETVLSLSGAKGRGCALKGIDVLGEALQEHRLAKADR